MDLNIKIQNIKCIKNLEISFPLESGIYAITGENGSGKSTLIACASTIFYQMKMYDYFGRPKNGLIQFTIELLLESDLFLLKNPLFFPVFSGLKCLNSRSISSR